jgi:hypothetical protein
MEGVDMEHAYTEWGICRKCGAAKVTTPCPEERQREDEFAERRPKLGLFLLSFYIFLVLSPWLALLLVSAQREAKESKLQVTQDDHERARLMKGIKEIREGYPRFKAHLMETVAVNGAMFCPLLFFGLQWLLGRRHFLWR